TNELVQHSGNIEFLSIGSCIHAEGVTAEKLSFSTSADGQELKGVDLYGCKFKVGNLSGADLEAADLADAFFWKTDLSDANLRGAYLGLSFACNANFEQADLRKAHLRRSMLMRSDLRLCNLEGADLRDADLSGSDLRGAVLRRVEMEGAFYDPHTRWPSGFHPDQHGAVFVEQSFHSYICDNPSFSPGGPR
ncbi:MAG: pentapeptide repeat-containing protein, partial [Chloroflexi bacterium]|nr:pentapeptide repeat-containing protein [Chloroflexota bacterium]